LQLPSRSGDDLKAVMVWIHGGGFYMGSGNTQINGPDYLMAGDVVLVTFNYRLGALGKATYRQSRQKLLGSILRNISKRHNLSSPAWLEPAELFRSY
jgi:hypothetical protein